MIDEQQLSIHECARTRTRFKCLSIAVRSRVYVSHAELVYRAQGVEYQTAISTLQT